MKHLALFFFVSLFVTNASAQWTETSPNLLGTIAQNDGAMTYKAGTAWAGVAYLWQSTDKGKTWSENSLSVNGIISNIFFIDAQNGLVSTHQGSIYKTSDGGQTWKAILAVSGASSAVFVDNPQHIIVSEFSPGIIHSSINGGASWRSVSNNNWIREVRAGVNGGAALLSGDWPTGEHLWFTSDYGLTWKEQSGQVDCDSYSFDMESGCDSEYAYIINEEYSQTATYDGMSEIFASSDRGLTWTITSNHPSKFFAGSIVLGPNTEFCPTVSEANAGIFRSTDHGQTWKDIGGPSSSGDTRLIAVIDDNHIIASDIDGSIWITQNSGGDSVTLAAPSPASLLLPTSAEMVTESSCDGMDTSVALAVVSCAPVSAVLDSAWMDGSTAFNISDTRPAPRALGVMDSILVSYFSLASGDTARLHLRYRVGGGEQDTSVLITGRLASNLLSWPVMEHTVVSYATLGAPDTLSLAIDMNASVNQDSVWPYIHDMSAEIQFDSAVVAYAGYIPPAGWTITSLVSLGNALLVTLHNVSGLSVHPLDFGKGIFYAHIAGPITTRIALASLTFHLANESVSPCIANTEDNHWVIAVNAVSSVEAQDVASPIEVFPNPADRDFFIGNAEANSVSFALYDALGREVASGTALPNSTRTVTIEPLPSGSYVLVIHAGEGTMTRRINKLR
ncbi:MAG TPA: T9SS type A sorting domain-containing protein [Candidatus Kapabacteria bacterium]|nr:T9SS type A sorting domain-containing protein [Candidatus Kapabacteria bacterium]